MQVRNATRCTHWGQGINQHGSNILVVEGIADSYTIPRQLLIFLRRVRYIKIHAARRLKVIVKISSSRGSHDDLPRYKVLFKERIQSPNERPLRQLMAQEDRAANRMCRIAVNETAQRAVRVAFNSFCKAVGVQRIRVDPADPYDAI